jgi:hypothetical protein
MRKILIICFVFVLVTNNQINAQEEKYISLYLLNFINYVEWPTDDKSGDFVIEILGHNSVNLKLQEITANKKIGNQRIVVKGYESVDQMGKCHVIYVGHWQSRFLPEVLKKTGNNHTLIITEKDGMIELGAAINILIRDGKIVFEMKKSNVTKYGLSVNSGLENLAYKLY